jgi:hypothetical protein
VYRFVSTERQCVTVKLADPDNDGTVDREEFEAACAKGLVTYTDH